MTVVVKYCKLLLFLLVGFLIAAYVFHETVVKGKSCTSKAKLHGKTVIVTGSNTGIGKTMNLESGSSQVVFMQLDLASLKSVRSFAENFLKTEPRLDILINNAGLFNFGRTEDGFGMTFGVNHLGHFLLTNLLLDRLKECGPSRVVNVSSGAHNWGRVDFDCLNTHKTLRTGTSFVDGQRVYADSKLCNVLFTYELAKRLKGTKVTCYSLHPGVVRTDIIRNASPTFQLVALNGLRFFMKTPLQGSQTTLHCALHEGIEHLSGRHFSNCTARDVLAKAKDPVTAKKLWEISERFCDL
uniref:Dehydrogenase/reductase (SDR family) member 13b.1 n=1 Tax=Xiphophorus couchianus TaxID=32473 RepID=A0A3B5MWU2_9TELE